MYTIVLYLPHLCAFSVLETASVAEPATDARAENVVSMSLGMVGEGNGTQLLYATALCQLVDVPSQLPVASRSNSL